MQDHFGGVLTTDRRDVVEAWEATVHGLVAHRSDTAQRLSAVLALDPKLCVAHCLRGFALRSLARRELLPSARDALAAARESLKARGGTDRERRLVAALAAWCEGDSARASNELEAILDAAPSDLFAFKLDHGCRFMRGDHARMRKNAERFAGTFAPHDRGYGYALGMLAFAREETGELEGAMRAGRTALEHGGDDAWAAHAVAHVFEMRDRPDEGRRWIEECDARGVFRACNNFGGHVAWHAALFCVQLGDYDRALELYEDIVRHPPGDFREVSNASSLLYRLEEEGVEVGSRWDALAERVLPFAHDHGYAFADVHYALVLMRAGLREEARRMLDSLRRYALSDPTPDARVQRELGLSLVRGVIWLEQGRTSDAERALSCARDGAQRVGGSHAQRDLFRRLWIDAARGAGDAAAERAAIAAYLTTRPESPWARALA